MMHIKAMTKALYCLSCTNSVSPRHCHVVRKCDDGEVCFTESHTSENGVVVFDTGCASSQTCRARRGHHQLKSLSGVDPHYHHSLCRDCCSTNLCNTQGCGQQGYPLSRGPVCFDCRQVADATLCDQIRVCIPNQACYLQREQEFGDTFYTSSCINKHACSSHIDIFGRRSLDRCSTCCLADLCNNQCGDVASSSTTSTATTASTSTTTTSQTTSKGNRGREFLVLFMRNHPAVSGPLSVYITTNTTSTINITSSPQLNANIKSAVDTNASITSESNFTLPFDLTCDYSKVEPKAVMISTSEVSTVTIFDSFYEGSNDGTVVIPIEQLASQYLISTTQPHTTSRDYFSQFAIGALTDRTIIKIKFKMANNSTIPLQGVTYSDGDVFSITLDRLETFQIGHTDDLTGTFITSTQPIAVFSGNRCNQIMTGTIGSHVVTQAPPTTELDHQFIVPPFFHNSKTLIQIVAPTRNTINVTDRGMNSVWNLNEREFKNLESNQTVVIVSRQPVLVTGFGMGSKSFHVDPYMTVIPGMHQYVDYYKITVPAGYTENFLCIIIPAVSIDNLQINGFPIHQYNAVYERSVLVEEEYNIRVLQVPNTNVTFELSTSDKSKFGLMVYGHRRNDGYGFAGNFVIP